MAEYLKKVDLLSAAVEVEYLGRPRLMVSVATIGKMPSIEAVPMEYHNKVCEELARRHQAEILELTTDRPQGEWIRTGRTNSYGGIEVQCSNCGDRVMVQHLEDEWYCRHCGADMGMKGADDE